MHLWLTTREIAALQLPGLPGTRQGVDYLAAEERWRDHTALARPRDGREGGGGWEYHVDLLPAWARMSYVARSIDVQPTDLVRVLVDDDQLCARDRLEHDARLAVLKVANRFALASGMTLGSADDYFAQIYEEQGLLSLPDWVRVAVPKLSGRTIARWRARAKAGEVVARSAGLNRKDTGILSVARDGEIRHFILALIAKNPHFSAEDIRTTVAARFCADPTRPEIASPHGQLVPLPSLRAFQRTLGIWKEQYRNELLRISDPDGYRASVEFVMTATTRAERLNEVWQIDASPLDAITTTRGKRPTIYSCIDIYSRRILIMLTDTPRAHAVGLLMRRAILAWGVPEQVKTDNGSDFKAGYVERLFNKLKIEMLPTRAYDPRAKGVVERSIGTFQHQLVTRIPGFVGHNPSERKVLENRKAFNVRHNLDDAHMFGAELTDAQVAEMCDHWAEVEYAHRPHSGKSMRGRTPFEVASSYRGEVRRIDNVQALDLLLAPVAGKNGLRTVRHDGIEVNKVNYHLGTLVVGDKVFCRHDPADLGRLYVFKADEETFLGVAENWELLGLDPAESAARVRALQKAVSDQTVVPVRKMMRSIGPMDVANAQRAAADARKGSLVPFPQPAAKYQTAALKAALAAVTPDEPRQADARTKAEQARLIGKAGTVAALPETPDSRFRRALTLQARIDGGQPVVERDAVWLERYRQSSEFRGLSRVAAQSAARADEA